MMIWLFLWGCVSPAPNPEVDTAVEQVALWGLESVRVVSADLDGIVGVKQAFRSDGNDWSYLLDSTGDRIHTVTAANVQPRGSYCVGGDGDEDDCDGILRSPGQVSTNMTKNACIDQVGTRIALVQDKGRIEFVGTSSALEHWRHENSVYQVIQPPENEDISLVGPCFWVSGDLWLSGGGRVVQVAVSDSVYSFKVAHELEDTFRRVQVLNQNLVVLESSDGRLSTLDLTSGDQSEIDFRERFVEGFSVDRAQEELWVADGSSRQLRRFKLENKRMVLVDSFSIAHRVLAVEFEPNTGSVGVVEIDDSGRAWLSLYTEDGLQDTQPIEGEPLALIPPGQLGQLSVVTRSTGDSFNLRVWKVREPELVDRPLGAFVVTTLEEPFLNLEMPCLVEPGVDKAFSEVVDAVRANAKELVEIGLPVAVGVTWEFVVKAQECGEEGVLLELFNAGFELGHMVHSRPCYNCTDTDLESGFVAECGPSSPHYLLADDPTACWPDDPDYCDLGDSACWWELVGERALAVDKALPAGASFIFGADRHGLWDWDWVDGYRTFARADGSTGYPISLFAGQWAYSDISSFDDPRGKEPAPRHPKQMGNPWFVGTSTQWEQDSSFSELMYLPGYSVALIKAGEQQATGLHLLHLVNSDVAIALDQVDVESVKGIMRQAISHRSRSAMGSWYFHLRDIGSWSLVDVGEDGLTATRRLKDMKESIESEFSLAEVEWLGPTEIRERRLEDLD